MRAKQIIFCRLWSCPNWRFVGKNKWYSKPYKRPKEGDKVEIKIKYETCPVCSKQGR